MANYNSVEEIFASISNAEVIRNNSKNNDGVDEVTGTDWFVATVYVSGNSWMGTTSSGEDIIRVNRRDAASYYVYREEGTLYNYYNFLRIRWSGYSKYNATTDSYKLTYDVIFWEENGELIGASLHMIDIPTSNYDGIFNLNGSTTYVAPTTENPDVTYSASGVTYEVINLLPPYDRRYLVRSEGVIYTVTDDALTALTETTLSAGLFQTYGFDEMPSIAVFAALVNPELLFWQESEEYELPTITVTMTATPKPQTLYANPFYMTDATIFGIDSVSCTYEGSPLIALSFDGGAYEHYDSTNGWVTSTDTEGMLPEVLTAITADIWEVKVSGVSSVQIRVILNTNTDTLQTIKFTFINEE